MYSLQYMVREHLVEQANTHQRKAGHGVIRKHSCLCCVVSVCPSFGRCLNVFVTVLEHSFIFTFPLCFTGPDEMLALRWNSQFGSVFVDGSHFQHALELGDELKVDGLAPFLRIFDQIV